MAERGSDADTEIPRSFFLYNRLESRSPLLKCLLTGCFAISADRASCLPYASGKLLFGSGGWVRSLVFLQRLVRGQSDFEGFLSVQDDPLDNGDLSHLHGLDWGRAVSVTRHGTLQEMLVELMWRFRRSLKPQRKPESLSTGEQGPHLKRSAS